MIQRAEEEDNLVYSDEKQSDTAFGPLLADWQAGGEREAGAEEGQQEPVRPEIPSNATETAEETNADGQYKGRWYVIQVFGGYEEKVCAWCRAVFREHPGIMEACFIPRREERVKIHGEWKTVRKRLFIGYVFLISPDLKALQERLWDIPELTKLIGTGNYVIPLTDEEIDFLRQFLNRDGVAEMSTGIMEGDRVRIVSGSLVGLETKIVKIDRHKRKAWIEMDILGGKRQIPMGLEVAMKKIDRDEDDTRSSF